MPSTVGMEWAPPLCGACRASSSRGGLRGGWTLWRIATMCGGHLHRVDRNFDVHTALPLRPPPELVPTRQKLRPGTPFFALRLSRIPVDNHWRETFPRDQFQF